MDAMNSKHSPAHIIFPDRIGYINMKYVTKGKKYRRAFATVHNTDALILDFRCYPKRLFAFKAAFSLNRNNEKVSFDKQSYPDILCPGQFTDVRYSYLPKLSNALKFVLNIKPYDGKTVVVLVDANTLSSAEQCVMAIQKSRPVIIIGEQTAGSDGSMCRIKLTGNITASFTGMGISYPDGKETQRIGIPLDIEVHPTQKGITQGKDEILERAINFLKTGK
jgi:hypothetical protein